MTFTLAPLGRLLALTPRALTPLALLAAGLALVVPSRQVAGRSDVLLAVLVLATALGISAGELAGLRRHAGAVAVLSVVPLVVLAVLSWVIGRLFGGDVRDGLLAVGLSSSEVAAVGLVALAGADATVALGAVTGSLVLAAIAGPAAIGLLAGHAGRGGSGHLLARFALVVILPLAVGVALRSSGTAARRLRALDPQREGVAALAVAALVYAALSGTDGAHGLAPALAASVLLLAASAVPGALWWRLRPGPTGVPGLLVIPMRDFAVAAALAAQAFGNRAGAVPGVYGVVMLLGGSLAAGVLARRRRAEAER
ncbi:MAG TPA: bile acid:sodium symporter [Solirubrobacteraceae bacterium]|jgi:predicted Na+-dependent transporter|nr:bile acid:sodium symporter [Solirubrobacteraceae bacterium]